jgi:HEAT repeat protein
LAVKAIGDCVGLDAAFCQEVIGNLLEIYFEIKNLGIYEPLQERVVAVLNAIRGSDAADAIVRSSLRDLRSHDDHICVMAAETLGMLGTGTREVLDGLRFRIKDDNRIVRETFANALAQLEGDDSKVSEIPISISLGGKANEKQKLEEDIPQDINSLLQTLEFQHKYMRNRALEVLSWVGVGNPEVAKAVLKLVVDSDKDTRSNAIKTLGHLRVKSLEVMNNLVMAMKDPKLEVRICALGALGELQVENLEVIEAILEVLRDESEDESVRISAIETLEKLIISTQDEISTLLLILTNENPKMRGHAIEAVGRLSSKRSKLLDESERDRIIKTLASVSKNISDQTYVNMSNGFQKICDIAWQALWDATSLP